MSKLIGIDIRSKCLRVAVLSTRYRRVAVDALMEVDLDEQTTITQALRAAQDGLGLRGEAVACGFNGDVCFIHRLELPAAASKRLQQIVPFELEAQVPVDIDELVYDYRELGSSVHGLSVLTAAARTQDVQDRIALIQGAIGNEPERVSLGGLPLANLVPVAPSLAVSGVVAVFDVGDRRSELLILRAGRPVFARALSIGIEGLPDSASELAAALKQSLAAWALGGGDAVTALYLTGSGSDAPGAEDYLSTELGMTVTKLTVIGFNAVAEGLDESLVRFARALGIALGLRAGARDLDLRRGALTYQRGYGFLKEKVPLLAGLAAAVFVSFLFFAWAQSRTLAREREVLQTELAALSKQVLLEETSDPERVSELLGEVAGAREKDPEPSLDAFDVMVKFSESVPEEITHDIEEFDVQRGHVKIYGIVDKAEQAEQIAAAIGEQECVEGAKISKIAQKVNSDKQKYTLEFELKCPEDKAKTKSTAGSGSGSSEQESQSEETSE
jgi:general secretion pathway protein L